MVEPGIQQDPELGLETALLALDRVGAIDLLQSELASEGTAIAVIERLVVPTLVHMGDRWERGELALAQIYMGGRICEELLDILLPAGSPERRDLPRMAIAVLEDFHILGKRIVYSALRASGYELIDYGSGLAPADLARRAVRDGVEILLISTLMLHSALRVKQVRTELEGLGASLRIVVGGAPFLFDPNLWKEVGADAMGGNAAEAIRIVGQMVKEPM